MRFAILGDLHYSIYRTPALCQSREEYYDILFSSVLAQKPDAIFAIGDIVDNGYPEEFEGLFEASRRAGLYFHTVNGNHDLLELTKPEIAQWTGNSNPYYSLLYNSHGKVTNEFDREASRFVVMDTPKEKSPKDHGGYVAPDQLKWLKQQLDESADQAVFTFGHHPVHNATRWSGLRMLNIDNSRDVKMAFYRKQQGQAFYFCGHNHANSIVRRNNWTFIQTAAPLRTNDYRLVEVTPEAVEISTVELPGKRAGLLAREMMKAMGDFLQLPAKGWAWDRKITIPTPKAIPMGEGALSF